MRGIKTYPLRMDAAYHSFLHEQAAEQRLNVKDFIFEAIEEKVQRKKDDETAYELILKVYKHMQGEFVGEVEKELVDYLLKNK